ncbi:MAG: DUF5009 domain-containing protein [Magnetococcales bacterium]|nr:DUF5009 domain-containing protein [Magnetococcales bacterium]
MNIFPNHTVGGRLLALDVLRGITFAGMMLVNNAGDWNYFYSPLRHAAWHGWTLADMVFPFFLWIVGLSLTLSLSRRRHQGATVGEVCRHLLARSLLIFGLGLFLSGFPFGLAFDHHFSWATMRIPGVLQRIAICYGVVGLLVLTTSVRTQWILTWLIVILSWLLLVLVPVPGFGAGDLTPEGNLARFIDAMVLAGHTWTAAPAAGFDPEGLFSTLPAMATCLFGVLTGHFLKIQRTPKAIVFGLFAAGIFLIGSGLLWDHWLPINKGLWTSSYVLLMAGLALVMFAGCFGLVDIRGWQRWTRPWVTLGTDTLLLYFISGLIGRSIHLYKVVDVNNQLVSFKTFYFRHLFLPFFDPWMASFLHAVAFVFLMYVIAWGTQWGRVALRNSYRHFWLHTVRHPPL